MTSNVRYIEQTGDSVYVVSSPVGKILAECYDKQSAIELGVAADMVDILRSILVSTDNDLFYGTRNLTNEIKVVLRVFSTVTEA